MKTLLALFLGLASPSFAGDMAQVVQGAPRVIGQVLYTDVGVTTTTTAGTVVHFSTITIPANTLARTGDTIIVSCDGTMPAVTEIRMIALELNGVVISTRSASNTLTTPVPWGAEYQIIRTGVGANITQCGPVNGPTVNICTTTSSIYGPSTIDETIPWVVACVGKSQTQGSTSFLRHKVLFIPAP